MARESTGRVVERTGKRGVAYAVRVRAYAERHCLSLAGSSCFCLLTLFGLDARLLVPLAPPAP